MIEFSQDDALFMRRCFDLARLGAGHVSPNPMVGAVIVYEGRIIGEGFHAVYGQAHAEVSAVASVAPEDLPGYAKAPYMSPWSPVACTAKRRLAPTLFFRVKSPK
ncbi:MAG: hypothetical protein IPI11_00845 [Haliscomenobacter sp.]|nr:hypothetical protein [Haliscomenobacter sp.]